LKNKILIITGYSVKEIRENCDFTSFPFRNILKTIFNKKKKQFSDYGVWSHFLINELKKNKDVELHVINFHPYMNSLFKKFIIDGVNFYCISETFPFLETDFIRFKFLNGFNPLYRWGKYYVKKIVAEIQPDVINLIGMEHPNRVYSILGLSKIPIFGTVTTVYSDPNFLKYLGKVNKIRSRFEILAHKHIKYFGCSGLKHRDLVMNNNPKAIFFKLFPVLANTKIPSNVSKLYDFVHFAGFSESKGIIDSIKALLIVKQNHPNVTLNIIGVDNDIKLYQKIKRLIVELSLNNNIILSNRFKTIEEMHAQAIKSKIAVQPVKLDLISGAMIEAMRLGLTLLTTNTGGASYFNKNGEAVLLSEINDINGLAQNMNLVLDSPEYASLLANNAKNFAQNEFENEIVSMQQYKSLISVINHYKNGCQPNSDLLINESEFIN
jgi:glycosyltransferase involved in cell wall biosynthesis